jgi:hypothetical protein
MRALKEQNDVLRAQAATFLEGTRDDASPASPPEDPQVCLCPYTSYYRQPSLRFNICFGVRFCVGSV